VEYAAPMDVTEGAAERGEEMEYLCLCERHLAPGTLDAVDQVAPCAKLHHNDHRAATVVVPVEEDVLKPDNARMLDPLKAGGFEQRLVRIERPVLRVPTLCIHLQTPDEREAFKVNKENHLQPILATEALRSLSGDAEAETDGALKVADEAADEAAESGDTESDAPAGEYYDAGAVHGWSNGQEPLLVSMLSEALGVAPEES